MSEKTPEKAPPADGAVKPPTAPNPDAAAAPHPEPAPGPAAAQPAEPPITINGQYIKDLSFEAPTAPGIFGLMQEQEPKIDVNIDVNVQPMQEDVFEVVLHVKADCKVGETVAFIVELAYGGLFTLKVPPEHLQPVLLVECPRLLFPYVRYIISDATRDGGFPPLLLGPVDFVAMYQKQLQDQQAAPAADKD
jgi:preprotein translocase subunit SecB